MRLSLLFALFLATTTMTSAQTDSLKVAVSYQIQAVAFAGYEGLYGSEDCNAVADSLGHMGLNAQFGEVEVGVILYRNHNQFDELITAFCEDPYQVGIFEATDSLFDPGQHPEMVLYRHRLHLASEVGQRDPPPPE